MKWVSPSPLCGFQGPSSGGQAGAHHLAGPQVFFLFSLKSLILLHSWLHTSLPEPSDSWASCVLPMI